jgi:hypothetical protein
LDAVGNLFVADKKQPGCESYTEVNAELTATSGQMPGIEQLPGQTKKPRRA